jgi:hypothetical protein
MFKVAETKGVREGNPLVSFRFRLNTLEEFKTAKPELVINVQYADGIPWIMNERGNLRPEYSARLASSFNKQPVSAEEKEWYIQALHKLDDFQNLVAFHADFKQKVYTFAYESGKCFQVKDNWMRMITPEEAHLWYIPYVPKEEDYPHQYSILAVVIAVIGILGWYLFF